ncbi:MAG: hypothetical protein REH79_03150 [Spiroplasma sp.]|nr:hypothetical protein [Spiroplasma sp.]
MSAREKTIYVNQDNIGPQINLGRGFRFLKNYNVSVNLNDIRAIELRSGDTLVTFMNEEEVSYGKEFFDTTVDAVKNDKQFFRNDNHIINLDFLARVVAEGDKTLFILDKGLSGTYTAKLGKGAWEEFKKHLNK